MDHQRQKGFTIVELLVVIVVIGILAAVTIIAFNGITARTTDVGVQSDGKNIETIQSQYGALNNTGGKNWYSGNGADADLNNYQPSPGNVIDVVSNSNNFCVRIYNPKSPQYKSLPTSYKRESNQGSCANLRASASAYSDVLANGANAILAAGSTNGFNDGVGAAAQFQSPTGLAITNQNIILVADTDGMRIRTINLDGLTSTLTGSTCGSTNGTLATARVCYPIGIAADNNGDIYVTESNKIRKISTSGNVTTLAGSGTQTYADGTGIAASFWNPKGIVIDSTDAIYVADADNHRIRKVSPSGVVTTVAGSTSGFVNATGTAARFNAPYDIAIDSSDNLYVADTSNHVIRKITASGVVTTVAGTGNNGYINGPAASARFFFPRGLTVDPVGNIYVADTFNNVIRKITPGGTVSTLAGSLSGSGGNVIGTGTAARFAGPSSIKIDAEGRLFVVDTNNHSIRRIE